MRPFLPPSKATPIQRLTALTAKIEAAHDAVAAGKRIDMAALDAESLAIYKQIKSGKPSADLQDALKDSIRALERLTSALETRVETLKNQKS